jgi:hypothetical protein
VVVDDEHLDARPVRGEHRAHAPLDVARLVARRHDHRHAQRVVVHVGRVVVERARAARAPPDDERGDEPRQRLAKRVDPELGVERRQGERGHAVRDGDDAGATPRRRGVTGGAGAARSATLTASVGRPGLGRRSRRGAAEVAGGARCWRDPASGASVSAGRAGRRGSVHAAGVARLPRLVLPAALGAWAASAWMSATLPPSVAPCVPPTKPVSLP